MRTNFENAVIKSGIKGKDIALKAGVTPEAVSLLRKKGIKKIDTAKKYADALGVNAFYLLG